MIRKSFLLSAGALTLVLVAPAHATTLDGSLVLGINTTNYFAPGNGFVPAGFGNSASANGVTIGGGTEFGFADTTNRDTADFTATGFTITDISSTSLGGPNFIMKFTANDSYFTGLSLVSDTFGGSFSLVGNVFTYNAPVVSGITTRTAVFSVGTPAGVPEPATWAMMLLGFGVIGAAMRKSHGRQTVRYNFA
jgi:hypothetical protein